MQVYHGVGPAYPRGSLQQRKHYLWVREFLCLRSMSKRQVCFSSSQCHSRGLTPLPELLQHVAWIHQSAQLVQGSLHQTSLHDEGISPVLNTQWTSISHTTLLDLGLLSLKIKEDIFTVNTAATYCGSLVKRNTGILQDLTWVGMLTWKTDK